MKIVYTFFAFAALIFTHQLSGEPTTPPGCYPKSAPEENPPPDKNDNQQISSRDGHENHYNLYDRNYDRRNWDIRENWENDQEDYYRGGMEFESIPYQEKQERYYETQDNEPQRHHPHLS